MSQKDREALADWWKERFAIALKNAIDGTPAEIPAEEPCELCGRRHYGARECPPDPRFAGPGAGV